MGSPFSDWCLLFEWQARGLAQNVSFDRALLSARLGLGICVHEITSALEQGNRQVRTYGLLRSMK